MANFFRGIVDFLKSFVDLRSTNSTKLLALLISALTGEILTLSVAFVLVYDVLYDGVVQTDMWSLGFLLLCIASVTLGAGLSVKNLETINNIAKMKGGKIDVDLGEIDEEPPRKRHKTGKGKEPMPY